ncbi:MAG TPA: hypothetical protein VGF94_25810 [Kofleriaceae bacterium]|jgi:hypothetical protein
MKRYLVLLAVAACQNALDQRLAIVDDTRVLAIASQPAEVKPGAQVAYSVLVASPAGPVAALPAWYLCTAPKPPTEADAVSTGCFDDASALVAIDPSSATVPADACMQFGPDVPPGGFRPRDPDPTGGYYQPVRADLAGAALSFGFTRITCDLANAPVQVSEDYLNLYVANANPTLAIATPPTVAAGSAIALVASWQPADAETYLDYDPVSETLVTRREAMHVSWYATGGALPVDASEIDEDDLSTSVSTTWTAPASPGTVYLWFVLRDSRGGVATASATVAVQ